jgi:alkylation response protein AidB-like acyl-CoA dehydrogenase
VLVEQIGLTTLLVDEENGGAGAGISEVAVVLENLASALAVVPALSSLASATALLRLTESPASSALSKALSEGEITATVAWPHPGNCDVAPVLVGTGVVDAGATISVSGYCEFVLDGMEADVLLAPAVVDGQVCVVSVDTAQDKATLIPMRSLDLTRGLASVEFSEATGTVLGTADISAALDLALVFIAAEQVGIAQRCHNAAVEWARERVQFDRPIGQFQAIKHQLVDLLMDLELARSALDVAVEDAENFLAEGTPNSAQALAISASAAKARCGEAAMTIADESLHIFGGIGFTWEHDAHLYLRRAKTLEVMLGAPATHRARFGSALLQPENAAPNEGRA